MSERSDLKPVIMKEPLEHHWVAWVIPEVHEQFEKLFKEQRAAALDARLQENKDWG